MARKPRVHYPAAVYHVILRGNGGQEIFFSDEDCFRYYLLLQEGTERYGHQVHAFCLMTNHVHLAIQVREVGLARIMQNIAFRYTRWINGRHNRTGHLFQGRYKAVLIDANSYLLELTRYIHLSPVRSGMVRRPEDDSWSGHRAYLGLETILWLTTDWVLSLFSKRLSLARRAYTRFVHDGKHGAHQEEYHKGTEIDSRILGDDDFIDRVLDGKPRRLRPKANLDKIIFEICRQFHYEESDFFNPGRNHKLSEARGMAAWLVLELGVETLAELSRRVGRDVTTLSAQVRQLQVRSKTDSELTETMGLLLKAVS